jgi:hypothetical protein
MVELPPQPLLTNDKNRTHNSRDGTKEREKERGTNRSDTNEKKGEGSNHMVEEVTADKCQLRTLRF